MSLLTNSQIVKRIQELTDLHNSGQITDLEYIIQINRLSGDYDISKHSDPTEWTPKNPEIANKILTSDPTEF